MRYLLLTAALAMNMQAMVAQSSYQVKNSVTLRNEDCDLTKMSVILPVPVSNIYQDVVGLKESSGMVLDLDASNRYLRDIKTALLSFDETRLPFLCYYVNVDSLDVWEIFWIITFFSLPGT